MRGAAAAAPPAPAPQSATIPISIGYNFNRRALFNPDQADVTLVVLSNEPWCIWTPGPYLSHFIGRGVQAPVLYVGHHTTYDEFFMNYMARRVGQGLDTNWQSQALENLVQHSYMFSTHCIQASGGRRGIRGIRGGDYDLLYIEKLELTEDEGDSQAIIDRVIDKMKEVMGIAALEQWGKDLHALGYLDEGDASA